MSSRNTPSSSTSGKKVSPGTSSGVQQQQPGKSGKNTSSTTTTPTPSKTPTKSQLSQKSSALSSPNNNNRAATTSRGPSKGGFGFGSSPNKKVAPPPTPIVKPTPFKATPVPAYLKNKKLNLQELSSRSRPGSYTRSKPLNSRIKSTVDDKTKKETPTTSIQITQAEETFPKGEEEQGKAEKEIEITDEETAIVEEQNETAIVEEQNETAIGDEQNEEIAVVDEQNETAIGDEQNEETAVVDEQNETAIGDEQNEETAIADEQNEETTIVDEQNKESEIIEDEKEELVLQKTETPTIEIEAPEDHEETEVKIDAGDDEQHITETIFLNENAKDYKTLEWYDSGAESSDSTTSTKVEETTDSKVQSDLEAEQIVVRTVSSGEIIDDDSDDADMKTSSENPPTAKVVKQVSFTIPEEETATTFNNQNERKSTSETKIDVSLFLEMVTNDSRLPTNSPSSIVTSSSVSATTLAYQHYENLKTLVQSRHVLKRIKSRTIPSRSGSNNNSSNNLQQSAADDSKDDISIRKANWLLLRNGITISTTPPKDTTEETTEEKDKTTDVDYVLDPCQTLEPDYTSSSPSTTCEPEKVVATVSSSFGEIGIDSIEPPSFVSLSDSTDSNTTTTKDVEDETEKVVATVSSSFGEVGIDSIQPPSFISISDFPSSNASSTTSLTSAKLDRLHAARKIDCFAMTGTLKIQQKGNSDGSNLFYGLRIPSFTGTILSHMNKTTNPKHGSSTLLYNIYREDGGNKKPFLTVHETLEETKDDRQCVEGAGGGATPQLEESLTIYVKHSSSQLPIVPSNTPSQSASSSSIGSDDGANKYKTGTMESPNNNVLIIKCQECSAPDCSLHSAEFFTSNGDVKLGTAHFLRCDKEHPVLVLRNLLTDQKFILRIPDLNDPAFFVHESLQNNPAAANDPSKIHSQNGDNDSKHECEARKDGPLIGFISRSPTYRHPLFTANVDEILSSDDEEVGANSTGFKPSALYLNFAASMNSNTKTLLLGGTILINHDILLS